jgi:subtilase family serine protease
MDSPRRAGIPSIPAIAMKYPVLLIFLTLCLLVSTTGAAEIPDSAANAIHVDAPPTLGIDLRPYTFSPPTGGVPRTFTITSSVKNFGGTNAGGFGTEYYLSTDTTITTADHKIGTSLVAGCAAGGTVSTTKTVTVSDTVGGGFYYVGMIVDAGNDVAEMNENNNIACSADRVTIPEPARPDLQPQSISPPSGHLPRTFRVLHASVQNIGAAPAGPLTWTAHFYLSRDAVITTADYRVGSGLGSDSSLAAGGEAQWSNIVVTIPSSVPAGTYYFGLIADDEGTLDESDENNNVILSSAGTITIDPYSSLPNLVCDRFGPPSSTNSRMFTIPNRIVNNGDSSSGAFEVWFYLSSDTTFSPTQDIRIATQPYGSIGARDAMTFPSTSAMVPSSVPAGRYYLFMSIDPQNAVVESWEADNVVLWDVVAVIMIPPASGFSDLAASVFMPPSGAQPRTFTIPNAIRNYCDDPADAFSVGFYLSPDQTITTADTLIGTRTVNLGLAGQAETPTEATSVTVPNSVGAGTYYVGMIIDPSNAVAEWAEDNNVEVGASPITIAALVSSLMVQAEDYDQGGEGVAYHDLNNYNEGGVYRTDGVDIEAITGGYTVAYIREGEWLRYTLANPPAGATTLTFRVACWQGPPYQAQRTIEVQVNGVTKSTVNVPVTGSSTAYTTVTGSLPAALPANAQVKLVFHGGSMNLDWFSLSTELPQPTVTQMTTVPTLRPLPGASTVPKDPNGDGWFEDVNGNNRLDFADVSLYFNQMTWIAANLPVGLFDFNDNGRIDFADVTWLFNNL